MVSVRRRTPWPRTRNGRMDLRECSFGGWRSQSKTTTARSAGRPIPATANPESYCELHLQQHSPVLRVDKLLLKIREMTLSYSFPRRMIGKALDGLTLSFVARNRDHLQERSEHRPTPTTTTAHGKGIEYGLAALAPAVSDSTLTQIQSHETPINTAHLILCYWVRAWTRI